MTLTGPRSLLVWAPALVAAAALVAGCASTRTDARGSRQIAGRTYVVTGASSGFGRGVALRLGAQGANVVLAARRTELLEQVAAEIHAAGGAALVVTTDVSRPGDVQRLGEVAVERFGRIDVWINNAGLGAIGRFWDIPVEDHARLVDINLNGVIYGSHVALRQFRAQGAGTLVNVGSIESELPLAYHATYAASKSGVLSLGRSLNEELRLAGLDGIRVATVLPWAADTPFDQHAANYSGGTVQLVLADGPDEVVDAIVRMSLWPREELAVGWKAKGAYAAHRLLPDVAERMAANIIHHVQMERAPPAPPTSGALHEPVPAGRGVDGTIRERLRREKAAREERPEPAPEGDPQID
jgi:short-subunit dehydrogenase